MSTSLLIDAVVTLILENGFLLASDIVGRHEMLLIHPACTIKDLKDLVQQRFGILREHQRISVNGVNVFHGPIISDRSRFVLSPCVVRIEPVPLDPRLLSLFDVAGLGDVDKRDEIMGVMAIPRVAKTCNCGDEVDESVDVCS
jgi:hypothetical protein